MNDNKIMSIEDARNRQKEKNDFRNRLKVDKIEDDYEERKSGKVVEPYLEEKMRAKMKQLIKDYYKDGVRKTIPEAEIDKWIIGLFTSEFEKRYVGDIEEYAKKILDDLKKGNESR